MAQIDGKLVGDVTLEYERKERAEIIAQLVSDYVLYCYENETINAEDLLILTKYFDNNMGVGENRFLFIVFDEDEVKSKNYKMRNFEDKVIDLRPIVSKLQQGIEEFDWSKLDGYFRVNKSPKQNGKTPQR